MTVWPAVPPVPEQVSVYSVLLASAPVVSLPLVPFPPLHPPDATQAAALVDDHVRLADAACWTVAGVTASDRVGAGAGVGAEGVDGGEGVVEGESPPPPPQPTSTAATSGRAERNTFRSRVFCMFFVFRLLPSTVNACRSQRAISYPHGLSPPGRRRFPGSRNSANAERPSLTSSATRRLRKSGAGIVPCRAGA